MDKHENRSAKRPLVCAICHRPIDEKGPDKRHHIGSLEDGVVICVSCCADIDDHSY